jgi:hypothetical protein
MQPINMHVVDASFLLEDATERRKVAISAIVLGDDVLCQGCLTHAKSRLQLCNRLYVSRSCTWQPPLGAALT